MGNEIRLGKISAIDYAAGTVRVVYHEKDDAVTRPIPLISSEYFMPEIGDQVLVLHLPNGTEAGVVIGRPWSDKNKPPEGAAGLYRKDLARKPGEAMIRYQGGVLTIKAAKVVIDGNLEVTGNINVTGNVETTGNLAVGGSITSVGDTVANGKSLTGHAHTDSMGGSTSAPT